MIDNLNFVKQLGFKSKKLLETGKLSQFAELMNEQWEFKQSRSRQMSNKNISKFYKGKSLCFECFIIHKFCGWNHIGQITPVVWFKL